MADIEKIERELRENLASFDAEVAYELENEGERADLWTDIDVPVEAIRVILSELSRMREVEVLLTQCQKLLADLTGEDTQSISVLYARAVELECRARAFLHNGGKE